MIAHEVDRQYVLRVSANAVLHDGFVKSAFLSRGDSGRWNALTLQAFKPLHPDGIPPAKR